MEVIFNDVLDNQKIYSTNISSMELWLTSYTHYSKDKRTRNAGYINVFPEEELNDDIKYIRIEFKEDDSKSSLQSIYYIESKLLVVHYPIDMFPQYVNFFYGWQQGITTKVSVSHDPPNTKENPLVFLFCL